MTPNQYLFLHKNKMIYFKLNFNILIIMRTESKWFLIFFTYLQVYTSSMKYFMGTYPLKYWLIYKKIVNFSSDYLSTYKNFNICH